MNVALVHDYLIQDGGAERTLLALHELYPEAPIFTLFYDPEASHPKFRELDIRVSRLNRLPFAPQSYQWYLPFMAQATEAFDLSDFDLVISSSSSFAKGVIAAPHGLHICYCHTPTRFLWQERLGYVNELPQPKIIKWLLPPFLHRLRQWDRYAAERPDILLTNSQTSQNRIQRYYRRDARVIHPPVDVQAIQPVSSPGQYWLTGGRLVAYKRFDLVVRAFRELGWPLKIFGIGPERKKLERLAGPKTEFLGRVDDQTKAELYARAIAFLHPHMEDFGITAVESMAAGRPVIAYGKGGATETMVDGVTGKFLEASNTEDLTRAIASFDPSRYSSDRIRAHAERFSKQRFLEEMRSFIKGVTNYE
ncbi:MAG: glycosyltransferase [Candidatus Uhrbacteria bacterium]|nr:glycosyltransferase [Candidatus Uhrbacteria bacterium]